jgi:tetratricopeptide (TPR) repeat protein
LIQKTGLTLPDIIYKDPVKTYLASVNLYNRSRILREEQIKLWRDRIDSFVQAGRAAELNQIRQQMYTSLNSVGKPISISIHDMLSELLLQQKNYSAAIEEIDYAITFAPDDVHLLHRKALAYLGLGKRNEAKQLVDEIILRNNNLKINSDIASLQGRIHRELWEIYHSPTDLEDALNAYYRAYLADKTSYYTGINAAELAFTKGDEALGIEITKEVLATCQAFQSQPIVSFWVDFSTGAAYLGLAEIDKAIAEYEKGLNRNPKPRPRERESALKGASRMAEAKKLSSGAVDRIQALLQ